MPRSRLRRSPSSAGRSRLCRRLGGAFRGDARSRRARPGTRRREGIRENGGREGGRSGAPLYFPRPAPRSMVDPLWERVPLRDIAAHYPTPVLVMSEERVRANLRDLFAGLGAGVVLRYCAKTNPELRLLEIVREEGAHVLAS